MEIVRDLAISIFLEIRKNTGHLKEISGESISSVNMIDHILDWLE